LLLLQVAITELQYFLVKLIQSGELRRVMNVLNDACLFRGQTPSTGWWPFRIRIRGHDDGVLIN
jgi:hypothetical protein